MSTGSLFKDKPVLQPQNSRRVLVPFPVDKAYDYALPDGLEAQPGDYVVVPLGKREIPGIVWGDAEGTVVPEKLKSVVARYELPPLHSITSSARTGSVGGTSRPSALAVLRLSTNSNRVDCTIGRSAGFSPLRIRAA